MPLETQEFSYSGQNLCIPTYNELLRIKAYLLLTRGYTRDYVDFLALSAGLEPETLKGALISLDALYRDVAPDEGSFNMLFDLGMALKAASPKDADREEWNHFDAMHSHDRPWDLERIRLEGQVQGERVLTVWEYLSNLPPTGEGETQIGGDASKPRDADSSFPHGTW